MIGVAIPKLLSGSYFPDWLGVTSLSKSQGSEMAKDADEQVEAFRTRPLDAGPYTFVAADALMLKVGENGRIIGVHTLIATGVNAEGCREILGVQVSFAEDGAGWLTPLCSSGRDTPSARVSAGWKAAGRSRLRIETAPTKSD